MDYGDAGLDEGTTPFMRAARSGDAATMRLLLEADADAKLVDQRRQQRAADLRRYWLSRQETHGTEAQALEALKSASIKVWILTQTNAKGENALHGAANRGSDLLVKFLVEHGVKLDARSKAGFTPLDIAMGKESFGALPVPHDSTVALLRSLGGPEGTRAEGTH